MWCRTGSGPTARRANEIIGENLISCFLLKLMVAPAGAPANQCLLVAPIREREQPIVPREALINDAIDEFRQSPPVPTQHLNIIQILAVSTIMRSCRRTNRRRYAPYRSVRMVLGHSLHSGRQRTIHGNFAEAVRSTDKDVAGEQGKASCHTADHRSVDTASEIRLACRKLSRHRESEMKFRLGLFGGE